MEPKVNALMNPVILSEVEGPGANRARLLVVDAKPRVTSFDALPSLLGPGDDALITGIHSPQESHYRLLGALLPPEKLAEAVTLAMAAGLEPHEFGDVAFIHKA